MKRVLAALLAMSVFIGFGPGCATKPTTDGGTTTVFDVTAAAESIRSVAAVGVVFGVQKDPNCKGYLAAAAQAVRACASDGEFDSVKVKAAIDKMTVNEIKDPEIEAAIIAGLTLYKACLGKVVTNAIGDKKVLLLALAQGIEDGLAASPADMKIPGKKIAGPACPKNCGR